jgi:hypothetical protein
MSSKPTLVSTAPLGSPAKSKKPPKFGGFNALNLAKPSGLKPLRTALATAIPAPVAITAIHAMVPPATAESAFHMRQDGQAAFLALIERFVERVSRIGDAFHRRRRGRHPVGALAQARHRIARIFLRRIHPRIGTIDPQLCKIPYRGLDRRPQFFLVGAKLQPGLHGRNARISKSRPVLGAHSRMAIKPLTMLGIGYRRTGDGERGNASEKNFLHVNLLQKGAVRMSALRCAINLQFGKSGRLTKM